MLWPGLFVMTMGENKRAKRRNKKSSDLRCFFVAVRTRLELATSGVTGRHSNQLNYRTPFPGLGVQI